MDILEVFFVVVAALVAITIIAVFYIDKSFDYKKARLRAEHPNAFKKEKKNDENKLKGIDTLWSCTTYIPQKDGDEACPGATKKIPFTK